MELLTIIGPITLDDAIDVILDIKVSQKVKAQKRDQAYMIDTIEELHQEVHNLQIT